MQQWEKQAQEIWASLNKTTSILHNVSIDLEALKVQSTKTDRMLSEKSAETDKVLQETSRKIDRAAELLGNIGNNTGKEAEERFYNSLQKDKRLGLITFDYIDRNWTPANAVLHDEFDIVLWNKTSVGLIEVKQNAHRSDLEKLYKKKLPNFRTLFPAYENHKIYLGLATLITSKSIVEKANEKGIAVLTQQGNIFHNNSQNLKAY